MEEAAAIPLPGEVKSAMNRIFLGRARPLSEPAGPRPSETSHTLGVRFGVAGREDSRQVHKLPSPDFVNNSEWDMAKKSLTGDRPWETRQQRRIGAPSAQKPKSRIATSSIAWGRNPSRLAAWMMSVAGEAELTLTFAAERPDPAPADCEPGKGQKQSRLGQWQ